MNKVKIFLVLSVSLVLIWMIYFFKTSNSSDGIGEDKNGNGVRDDVEAKIIAKYRRFENTKNAMFQFARAMQKASSDAKMTKARAKEIGIEAMRADLCIWKVEPRFTREHLEVEGWVVNSYQRSKNYNHYNAMLSGEVIEDGPDTEMCDFKLIK